MIKPTPTPWIDKDSEDCTHPVIDTDHICTARLISRSDYLHALHCVNTHDVLVMALTDALWHLERSLPDSHDVLKEKIRAALTLAKGD